MTRHVNWPAFALYGAGLLGLLVFMLRYSRTTWRRTDVGRWLMGFCATVAINAACALSVIAFGEYPGIQVVRFVGAATFAPAGWLMLMYLRRRRHGEVAVNGGTAPNG